MTVHRYFKTWWLVKAEHFKNFESFFNAVAKSIKRYDETGSHEDRHRKGRPRVTSAAEDEFIRVTSLRNLSPNKCFTDFKYQGSRVMQRSKALHLSARGVTTDTLVWIEALSQPAVFGSPTRRHTIGPALSEFGLCRFNITICVLISPIICRLI